MTLFSVKKKRKISKFAKPLTIDRISDLPDDILCHMLTFLPTKSAFATSVLSKRWTSLCKSLPIINFEDESVKNYDDFLRFCHSLDTVTLSPHVQHKPIKKFHLKFSRFGDWHPEAANVHKWIEAAKQRGVEDISLHMNSVPLMHSRIDFNTLVDMVFNSQNLVVLKLKDFDMSTAKFSVNLPSLKTLHLKLVFFEKCKDVKMFLSGCSILEELKTKNLFKMNSRARGFETSLSKLVRATISPFDIPFKAISNVEFLRILKMDEIDDHNEKIYRDEKIYPYYKDFPIFCNLIHLEIQFSEYDHSWDNIGKVLQHSPKLQILLIRQRSSSNFTHRKDWENPNLVPECVSSHLTTCTIINYEGWNGDLQFATYILKNARFLRVMKIKVCKTLSYRKSQILAELSSRPRSSEGCKLLFEFQG